VLGVSKFLHWGYSLELCTMVFCYASGTVVFCPINSKNNNQEEPVGILFGEVGIFCVARKTEDVLPFIMNHKENSLTCDL
jgi:hypothetical protein